jgi:acetyl-CoA carboxylase biotin carboxyl carrier protein
MTAPEQVRLFSRWLEGTDIALFELTTGQDVIRLRRDPAGPNAPPPEPTVDAAMIPAPSVGLFRRAHPLHTTPLVQPGQRVDAGDPVGLLQIGALLVHVVAPHAGTVLAVLAEDGAAVGYGTALIRFTKAGVQ